MIPRLLHIIWVGDERLRPDNCIRTWRDAHPDWQVRVWGNAALSRHAWLNQRHIAALAATRPRRNWAGVADVMRWEILHALGGVVIDADSLCLRPLDDGMLDCPAFAAWEQEILAPGRLATGAVGAVAGHPLIGTVIAALADTDCVTHAPAPETVGAGLLTRLWRRIGDTTLRVYPSHVFTPVHPSGLAYAGRDPVYAHQFWLGARGFAAGINRIDLPTLHMIAAQARQAGIGPVDMDQSGAASGGSDAAAASQRAA